MSTVKTAISIERALFREIDRLSRKLGLSRSRLFAQAVEEFLRRKRSRDLLARLNDVYQAGPLEEEKEWLVHVRKRHKRLLEDAW